MIDNAKLAEIPPFADDISNELSAYRDAEKTQNLHFDTELDYLEDHISDLIGALQKEQRIMQIKHKDDIELMNDYDEVISDALKYWGVLLNNRAKLKHMPYASAIKQLPKWVNQVHAFIDELNQMLIGLKPPYPKKYDYTLFQQLQPLSQNITDIPNTLQKIILQTYMMQVNDLKVPYVENNATHHLIALQKEIEKYLSHMSLTLARQYEKQPEELYNMFNKNLAHANLIMQKKHAEYQPLFSKKVPMSDNEAFIKHIIDKGNALNTLEALAGQIANDIYHQSAEYLKS